MSPGTFQTTCGIALLCVIAGLAAYHVRDRRRDRKMHLEDERERETRYRMKTGISDEELAEFASIVARYNDAGLEILDGEGEKP